MQQQHDRALSPTWTFNRLAAPPQPTLGSDRLGVYHAPRHHDSDYHHNSLHYPLHDQDLRLASPYNVSNVPAGIATPYHSPDRAPSPPGTRQHLEPEEAMAAQTPARHVGDGLDFRRPAGLRPNHPGREEERMDEGVDEGLDGGMDEGEDEILEERSGLEYNGIIDLTADDMGNAARDDGNHTGIPNNSQNRHPPPPFRRRHPGHVSRRLPRGMDIVIDLDGTFESGTTGAPPDPGSPDIEFISARPLNTHQRQIDGSHRSDQYGDEVQFLREQALPENDVRRLRTHTLDSFLNLLGTMNGNFLRAHVDRHAHAAHQPFHSRHRPTQPPRAGSQRGFRPPGRVQAGTFVGPQPDYELAAFNYETPGGRVTEGPPPTYEAPVEAPEGFTRSPDEEDVLVCPHCGDELCMGEDEVKRQVWIVKGCGHVYCGECATNRWKSKRTPKGKEKTSKTTPFKQCVVARCPSSVSNRKSMIQVFL